jgi:predicted phosphodiesterase
MNGNMKTFNKENLILIGDTHGNNVAINSACIDSSNSLIIHVGDYGLGFNDVYKEAETFNELNDLAYENNNDVVIIRGNHDSKERFNFFRNRLSNVHLPEDYEIYQYNDKTIMFVGGAISIDRKGRTLGISYWDDEEVILREDLCKPVDILITHTTPTYCFPTQLAPIVKEWAEEEEEKYGTNLLKELKEERQKLDKIVSLCKPKYHYYGHMHDSWMEEICGCKHRLLDIYEIHEHR